MSNKREAIVLEFGDGVENDGDGVSNARAFLPGKPFQHSLCG